MFKFMKSLDYDGFMRLLNLLAPFVFLALAVRGGIEFFSQYGFKNVYDVKLWIFLLPIFVLSAFFYYAFCTFCYAFSTYGNPFSRTKRGWFLTILSSVVYPAVVFECYYNSVSLYTFLFFGGLYVLTWVSRKIVSLERY